MSFRIGITIGDVVERDGDLLGDGVNIAARLEGLAEVGGICISRAVHEQVANKLSVQFADIGAQEVKNIPNPVHAYMVAMRREDGTYAIPQIKKPLAPPRAATANWMWPLAVTVVCLVAIGVGGFLYFTKIELRNERREAAATGKAVAPSPSPSATSVMAVQTPSVAATTAPPPDPSGEKFAAGTVPFVVDKARTTWATEYAAGADHKAFALNVNGIFAAVTGQPSDEIAKSLAIEECQKKADAVQLPRKCEIYALGNTVVYLHGRPPMPPLPWHRHDPSTEKPFAVKDMPLIRDPGKMRLESAYVPSRKNKAISLGPGGQFVFYVNGETSEESARRTLESCGALAGVACMIVAIDDNFVVPIPTSFKVTGFFRAENNPAIAAGTRKDVIRELAESPSGWSAVAVGASGRPGLGLKGSSEQNAVNDALGNCVKHDSDCRIIAIGPFAVGPS
jgi:adenylate cyclase